MSDAQTQLIKQITDLLSQNITQIEDATKLYATLNTSIALHISAGLPTLESKAFLALAWKEKEVKVCPGKDCFCKFVSNQT